MDQEMSKHKQCLLYVGVAVLSCLLAGCLSYVSISDIGRRDKSLEVVENPPLNWRNDRLPTFADCGNRTGLLWIFNNGTVKLRFYHNVQSGVYWATIVTPEPPREQWVKNIITAVEGNGQ